MSIDKETKVALVSNRGPVSFVDTGSGFEMKQGAGGLAGAMDPVAESLGDRAVWIAAAITDADRRAVAAGEAAKMKEVLGYPVELLDIEPQTYSRYYDVVSNRMLWFANHCLWDELNIKEFGSDEVAAWENAYLPVNRLFADAVGTFADPSWLILFQDYHLAMAPRYLRRRDAGYTIFHFTHSSFCGPDDGLERLPAPIPGSVIDGMLGADLIGFHVQAWADNFLACCERIGAHVDRRRGVVSHDGRKSWVREYPIPIDAPDLRRRASGDAARGWASSFENERKGALVVRADRIEPSKNVVRGFEAFGLLLDRRSDLADTTFIACLYPSRQSMPEYQRYGDLIEESVQKVNARHPDSVQLFTQDDYDRTLGALTVYDVLVVNPIMDGMNLVSKEGPTLNQKDGLLVLSRGAGSFEELGAHAIPIEDAFDVEETAAALARALDTPSDERRRLSEELRGAAGARSPEDWIDAQLEDLLRVKRGEEPGTPWGA
ncbi:MAG: trehalose-6-phosphate synthase [Actinomycetota bacterium]|nr:trehalose-6-phosphate synthase [Actinomycetota bacterium]